jgi:hypothetical protein
VQPWTTALDAATGRVLWRGGSADAVVLSVSRGGLLSQRSGNDRDRLWLTDSRTGREVWSREVDQAGFLGPNALFSTGSPRIAWMSPAGVVTVFGYADGAVLARGELGLNSPAAGDSARPDAVAVSIAGERIYASRRVRGRTAVTAYAVPSMRRVWQLDDAPEGDFRDCGEVLCIVGVQGVTVVDPASGAVRWRKPGWSDVRRFDRETLIATDDQANPQAALLDAPSGREVRRLGQSLLAGDLLLRTEGSQTLVSVPEGGSGGLRTVGSLTDLASLRCAALDGCLACPTFDGSTRVWRTG